MLAECVKEELQNMNLIVHTLSFTKVTLSGFGTQYQVTSATFVTDVDTKVCEKIRSSRGQSYSMQWSKSFPRARLLAPIKKETYTDVNNRLDALKRCGVKEFLRRQVSFLCLISKWQNKP